MGQKSRTEKKKIISGSVVAWMHSSVRHSVSSLFLWKGCSSVTSRSPDCEPPEHHLNGYEQFGKRGYLRHICDSIHPRSWRPMATFYTWEGELWLLRPCGCSVSPWKPISHCFVVGLEWLAAQQQNGKMLTFIRLTLLQNYLNHDGKISRQQDQVCWNHRSSIWTVQVVSENVL